MNAFALLIPHPPRPGDVSFVVFVGRQFGDLLEVSVLLLTDKDTVGGTRLLWKNFRPQTLLNQVSSKISLHVDGFVTKYPTQANAVPAIAGNVECLYQHVKIRRFVLGSKNKRTSEQK